MGHPQSSNGQLWHLNYPDVIGNGADCYDELALLCGTSLGDLGERDWCAVGFGNEEVLKDDLRIGVVGKQLKIRADYWNEPTLLNLEFVRRARKR